VFLVTSNLIKKAVSFTLGFAILTTLLDLIPPWIIKVIIDELVEGKETSLIYWIVAGLIGVYFFTKFFKLPADNVQ
jgi:hypothetical protein